MSYGQTEIIAAALEAAAAEMCASLIRTAYSPNVKERADCSTAVCDMAGRTLSLATHAPAHLGSTLRLVSAILARFPADTLRPGDIFFANDPYIVGVTHLNDCTMASPIFIDGEVVGFATAVAHHSDVGGRVPGSESGDSTSIFQEGIRVPPVRLFSRGEVSRDVLEIFLLNSRTPHFNEGDVYAQRAATNVGVKRVQELYARFGGATAKRAIAEMLDATERRFRDLIERDLKDGEYYAEDWLDEDGINDQPVKLAVRAVVRGRDLEFDFSACAGQLGTGKNVPYTHTMATVYYCVKAMIDPGLPINEGMYRPIKVLAPEGSVVNPRSPAGVGSRGLTSMILSDVIVDALSQAAPDRAVAPGGPYQGIILSGWDPGRKRFFVDYENFAGGHGASVRGDGMDVAQIHMTNTSNLPIEVMEIEFPVRVERYEIVADSGGAGRFRGGTGVCRELRILTETNVALRSARQKFPALGRDGGAAGTTGWFVLERPGEAPRRLPSTCSEMPLKPGDLLRIVSPGGGGYGDPKGRAREAVSSDVREGKVTQEAAQMVYGAVP
jgi:N-methylhydantoinase B